MVQRHIVAYLADGLQHIVDTSSRSGLRSASTALSGTTSSTVEAQHYRWPDLPVDATMVWNGLLSSITPIRHILLRRELHMKLFQWSHIDAHHWTSAITWQRLGNILGRQLAFIAVIGLLDNFNNTIIIITPNIYRRVSNSQEKLGLFDLILS